MSRRHAADVIVTLVERDLKVRYRHSVLGLVWSQLGPLALLAMMSIIFIHVIPLHVPHYPLFVVVGLLVWTWFATAVDAVADGGVIKIAPGTSRERFAIRAGKRIELVAPVGDVTLGAR